MAGKRRGSGPAPPVQEGEEKRREHADQVQCIERSERLVVVCDHRDPSGGKRTSMPSIGRWRGRRNRFRDTTETGGKKSRKGDHRR